MNKVPRDESCLKFEMELAEYLEGENCPAVAAHAQRCDFCRCILADVEQLRTVGRELILEEPPVALWRNVRSALLSEGLISAHPPSRKHWTVSWVHSAFRHPLPVSVSTAAVIALIVLFVTPGYRVRPRVVPGHPAEGEVFYRYMAPADVAQLTRTIRQLERSYRANEPLLAPSMKATYEKSLESLNNEIQECQDSMKDESDSGLTSQYLTTAYVQKADVLQSALEYGLRP